MVFVRNLIPCPGCGALFPDTAGATHRYMECSPGCWAAYGEVLAREYSDPTLFGRVHRLTVDAFAVQHPGRPSPQSIQSVAVHLISLCLQLEHDATPPEATKAIQEGSRTKTRYVWLPPPEFPGAVTVADVNAATSASAHETLVRQWAGAVWSAWSAHHAAVRAWLPRSRTA